MPTLCETVVHEAAHALSMLAGRTEYGWFSRTLGEVPESFQQLAHIPYFIIAAEAI